MGASAWGFGIGISLLMAPAAIAGPSIEITSESGEFRDRVIESGPMRVVADYMPDPPDTSLRYQIYVDDVLQETVETNSGLVTTLSLETLDEDTVPEVVVNTFTGGAHCCTIYTLYSWQGDILRRAETFPLDGGAGRFQDLDEDGSAEFITFDDTFLYAFASYAGSFPPMIILSYQDGQFIDVTRQFPERLRAWAWQMHQNIQMNPPEVNGILAGYVAQKIILGEYAQAWEYMLARYHPEDDWGLEIFDEAGNRTGRYADFPTALRAFLIDAHYLTPSNQPNPDLDLRDRIIKVESAVPIQR